MSFIQETNWYALFNTLLGELEIEYELDVTDHQVTIQVKPENYQSLRTALESAFNSLASALSYTVEVAPLQETVPEALMRFKSLLGDERFSDIAINPDELFNEKKGAQIVDGVLYSKPTSNKRTISVWTDALNALVADLTTHIREALKAKWENNHPIVREITADQDRDIRYEDIVKQNFGMRVDEQQKVSLFFNYRQLWQDLFVPELAIQSKIINAPSLHGSFQDAKLTINKAQLLDYLRQELHSDLLWRIFQTETGPVATPLYLDSTQLAHRQSPVSIVIDRSESMSSIFEKLTSSMLGFIEKLEPSTEVNILFFDDTIGPRKSFLARDLTAINSFVKSLNPKGSTYLYQALKVECTELLKTAKAGDSTAILLFTDGADGTPNAEAAINDILAIKARFQQKAIKEPKIYTIGIGHENSIQKLDPRLESERLIIRTVAEFEKVYKYINEIQNPTRAHELIVTPTAKQISAFKVSVEQNGNIQSPDIYITPNSVMGVIEKDKKQIVRLKATLPKVRTHDLVKRVMAQARNLVLAKNYAMHKELTDMHASVVNFSKQSQSILEKTIFEKLALHLDATFIQRLNQLNYATFNHIALDRRFTEINDKAPAFTMEYVQANQSLSTVHFSGAGQRLAAPKYNIAGKLISPITETTIETLPTSQFVTRISGQQNQMTVHALDKNANEQKRFYADCTPHIDELSERPYLHCQTDQFQAFVFPHEKLTTPSDQYDTKSCRPINYYDKPSVVCQGSQSTVVITPTLPSRPFDNLSENIALGAVLIRWGKALYELFTAPKQMKTYFTNNDVFQKKMKQSRQFLEKAKKKIQATQPFEASTFHLSEIEDYVDDLETLQRQFTRGTLEKSQLDEFYEEIKEFKEVILEDCDDIIEQRKHPKLITPQLKLEQQRDWGQLILPKPTLSDWSMPKIR